MAQTPDNIILQQQVAFLPYQIAPIAMRKSGKAGGMQIVNNFSLDEFVTEEMIRDAWKDEDYFKGKWTSESTLKATTTMSVECGQVIPYLKGRARVMGIDIDRDDEKIIEIVRHSLVRAGVSNRFNRTGKYQLSELVGKKGAKGVTYFCLVPDELKSYKQKLLDGKGQEVGDILYYRGDKRAGEKRPQQCYAMGEHKTFMKENRYRWTGKPLNEVPVEDLPFVNAAWLLALHTQIEAATNG